ncbi:secretin [[Haemophilus] ducreyi]|uniref:Competence protein E n=1 Tax=Haemophilus ducreyi (strain 35000HP / ATCC 700724) TaxID=233412 RepID=Q7VNQ3_HAEDU|nr:type IV pilus secretin PilQ [[Haemophilus] ducreyi]AAP95399.1 competence protein E [[Haemophilus] ducreyi 35000HP]AKO36275.1 secretin [[Haemophilus] ducreyi]AKO42225.1 secretin [[Haemophilus] ducreyi]ANF70164.1 secretin [[Haemophilus] ducreyi]ANF72652.1 secretin [[Haemophilus] ducreyi]
MRILFSLFFFISLSLLAQPLSLSLKNAPTAEILSYLAEENMKNIVLSDQIDKNTTLRIENSHFDEIVESIVRANQLSKRKEKQIYFIGHLKEDKAIEKIDNGDKPKLITQTIKLDYAKASEVIESLTKGKGNGNVLSEQGYLYFDERSNSLIIKDSPDSMKHILALIKNLDKPTEQIAIEARIVTISSQDLQELGVRWGMFSPSDDYHKVASSLETKGLTTANHLNVNFPVNNATSLALQVARINSRVLDLELTALEQENNVEIIASPRLLTTNKKPASIKQGAEIPYVLYNRKDEVKNIEFKEAVLGLQVTPHISADNQILLDLVVTQNSPNLNNTAVNGLITIDKQELNTQVFAKHGETIVLGGIFQHLTAKGEDRVPLLGSIPVLKKLFSHSTDKITKRELVIFVTPYLVQDKYKK